MNILDRILPWRRQIRNLSGLVKLLNADCQELADKLEKLKLDYHNLVGNASFIASDRSFAHKDLYKAKNRLQGIENNLRQLLSDHDGDYDDAIVVGGVERIINTYFNKD